MPTTLRPAPIKASRATIASSRHGRRKRFPSADRRRYTCLSSSSRFRFLVSRGASDAKRGIRNSSFRQLDIEGLFAALDLILEIGFAGVGVRGVELDVLAGQFWRWLPL